MKSLPMTVGGSRIKANLVHAYVVYSSSLLVGWSWDPRQSSSRSGCSMIWEDFTTHPGFAGVKKEVVAWA